MILGTTIYSVWKCSFLIQIEWNRESLQTQETYLKMLYQKLFVIFMPIHYRPSIEMTKKYMREMQTYSMISFCLANTNLNDEIHELDNYIHFISYLLLSSYKSLFPKQSTFINLQKKLFFMYIHPLFFILTQKNVL